MPPKGRNKRVEHKPILLFDTRKRIEIGECVSLHIFRHPESGEEDLVAMRASAPLCWALEDWYTQKTKEESGTP